MGPFIPKCGVPWEPYLEVSWVPLSPGGLHPRSVKKRIQGSRCQGQLYLETYRPWSMTDSKTLELNLTDNIRLTPLFQLEHNVFVARVLCTTAYTQDHALFVPVITIASYQILHRRTPAAHSSFPRPDSLALCRAAYIATAIATFTGLV